MSDRYTEVEHTSWSGRLGSSIAGIGVGLLLFIVAFPLEWWNEGRAVDRYIAISEGAGAAVTIDPATVDTAREGKVVHFSGTARSDQPVSDTEFDVTVDALALKREVEMYQWVEDEHTETRKNSDGSKSKVTTYDYQQRWHSGRVNSSNFKHRSGHENPQLPIKSSTEWAKDIQVGAYKLGSLAQHIKGSEAVAISTLPESKRSAGWTLSSNTAELSQGGSSPQLGDVRVTLTQVPYSEVSLIAQQSGDELVPFVASNGNEFIELRMGTQSIAQMQAAAESDNALLTWALRGLGLGLMVVGLCLIFAPLGVLGDFIPVLGDIIRAGTFVVALVISVVCSSLTIALAWLAYRPLISIPLFVLAAAAIAWLIMKRRRLVQA